MSIIRNTQEFNPLMARQRNGRALRLAAIAAASLAGVTLLLSAGVSAEPNVVLKPAIAGEATLQQAATSAAAQVQKPARQVRVIPLWNTPKDQKTL